MAGSDTPSSDDLLDGLKHALRAPPTQAYFYALVFKGTAGGQLLVSRKKIPAKTVADVRKQVGSHVVIQGVCYGLDGQLIFESPEEPAAPWLVAIKRLAKEAGLTLRAEIKQGRGVEEENEEEAGEVPPQPAPQPALQPANQATAQPEASSPAATREAAFEAAFTARLKTLIPLIAAAGARTEAAQAKLKLSEAAARLRSKDFAGAAALLKEIESLLPRAGAASSEAAMTTASAPQRWQAARKAWQEANDEVNEQLNALRIALMTHAKTDAEHAEALAEIADKGLSGLTGSHRVKLMSALVEVGSGDAQLLKAHGAKTLGLVTGFKAFLAESDHVACCDDNPFNVTVSLRATLEPVLDQLAQVLQAAA